MSETKFSPGPYIENGSGDDDIVICDALGEPVFAVIESFGPGEDAPEDAPDIVFHSDERIWANVALGLAAPDLYESLAAVAHAIGDGEEHDLAWATERFTYANGVSMAEACIEVRLTPVEVIAIFAALAKARGEATS